MSYWISNPPRRWRHAASHKSSKGLFASCITILCYLDKVCNIKSKFGKKVTLEHLFCDCLFAQIIDQVIANCQSGEILFSALHDTEYGICQILHYFGYHP